MAAIIGLYPWSLMLGYNPLYQALPTPTTSTVVVPPVTTMDVSWQDLNNDVNKFESSIGQLGRNLENCIEQMGRNLDGLGRNIENSFA